MKKSPFSVIIPGILLLLCSCAPIDYRAEAVEEAREFALKKYQDLSVFQQDFIRFNEPVILHSLIRSSSTPVFIENDDGRLTRFSKDDLTNPDYDTMHYAFVWDVPGLPGSLVVFAIGERSFRFRDMQRVFLKKYVTKNQLPVNEALNYMIRTQPGLTPDQRRLVRFAEPEEYPTTFFIEPEIPERKTPGRDSWMEYLADAAGQEKKTEQRSVVWLDRKTGTRLVTVGVFDKSGRWVPKKSLLLTEEEFVNRIDREAVERKKDKDLQQMIFHKPNQVRADPEE